MSVWIAHLIFLEMCFYGSTTPATELYGIVFLMSLLWQNCGISISVVAWILYDKGIVLYLDEFDIAKL